VSNLESGSTLGRYRIERFLGAGAMGEVYLAEDPHIERPIAIKTVRLVGRPQEVEDRKKRLLREARAAGRLLHPNVVTLFDTGEQEGVLFLAFEFVEGADLASLLESQGVLSLGEVLRIVRQTADALDYAHRQGIVHRDIKPSNILIDKHGRVKVADFGIAKVAGQSTELTIAGSVMGSPQYLSPEQIRGEDLDGRSDIFSLGVVVYELLLGRRPFEGDSITTLVYQILHKDLPAVSELRAVPPRLEQLLSRMLAKDRDARLANAAEVAREIAVIENELPDETLVAPANQLPALDQTYVLPKRMTTASLPTPPPSPSTKVSTPAAREARPGGELPPIPPLPGAPPPVPVAPVAAQPFAASVPTPTPVGTVIGPLPGATPVKEGRSWALLLVVLAAVLVLVAGVLLGWRLISSRLNKPADSVAETTESTVTPTTAPGVLPSSAPGTAPVPVPESSSPSSVEGAPGVSTTPDRTTTPEPVRIQPTQVPPVTDSAARTTPPRPVPPSQEATPRQEVPLPRPSERPRVEPPAPTPAPVETPAAEEEDDEPAAPAPGAVATGLALAFRVVPPDAFVLIDGRVIGKAEDWSGGKRGRSYTLPGPGRYEIKIKKDGLGERRIAVEASASGGVTPILATLNPLPAADVPSADIPVIRVSEAVAFRLQPPAPMAQIVVDGQSAGPAKQFGGGLRGDWLTLPEGRHRVSVVAPGRRRDFIVEVFPGSQKARERITVNLLPGGNQ
jgi:serine/threonine-protein kinase